jgi:hypothetical protein
MMVYTCLPRFKHQEVYRYLGLFRYIVPSRYIKTRHLLMCVEFRDIPGFKLHGECTAMAQASLSQSGKVGLRLPPNNGKHDLVGGLEHEFYDQPVTYLENLNIF